MRSRSGSPWSFVGVAVLVVLNVVLIGLLVSRPDVPASSQPSKITPPALTASPTQAETSQAVPTESPSPSVTEEAPRSEPPAEPATRLLVNASDEVAWRGTVGDCETAGELEHTVDAGQTWEQVPNDLAPLVRLRVRGPQSLVAFGGGTDCAAQALASYTAGVSWAEDDQFLAGSWYLGPADRARMSAPVGVIDTPCKAVDLVGTDLTDAAVLCTDGELAITRDGGANWQNTSPGLNARAIGIADGGYVLAGRHEQCANALAVSHTDLDGTTPGESLCAPIDLDDATQPAVTAAAGTVWLWAGDEVLVSTDDGRSW